ncbi:hypothetical protein E3T23_08405 [Cryobacterium cheniae]|uniref:Uncharacterized protein n=1 Tax=Cryobacterium cheniae TaxID=1259262 RepID=A0A4R8XT97_9MICO|nr:hypothetical protein E3T23_08405 [Cryobacterium cheniae]
MLLLVKAVIDCVAAPISAPTANGPTLVKPMTHKPGSSGFTAVGAGGALGVGVGVGVGVGALVPAVGPAELVGLAVDPVA